MKKCYRKIFYLLTNVVLPSYNTKNEALSSNILLFLIFFLYFTNMQQKYLAVGSITEPPLLQCLGGGKKQQ